MSAWVGVGGRDVAVANISVRADMKCRRGWFVWPGLRHERRLGDWFCRARRAR